MGTRMPIRWYAWSAVTDAYVACGGYGTRLYYWLIGRCALADATLMGCPEEMSPKEERPFSPRHHPRGEGRPVSYEAIYDPRLPDMNRRDGHEGGRDWQYPGAYCTAGNDCRSCARWRCTKCRKLRPYCVGGTGPHPGWCDDCVAVTAP